MNICILCEDANVEQARITGRTLVSTNTILSVPVSESGQSPATHWFCFMSVSQKKFNQLLAARKYTIMEESDAKDFLSKYNLKIIPKNQ